MYIYTYMYVCTYVYVELYIALNKLALQITHDK